MGSATGDVQNRAIFNSDNIGLEALRLISADQGGYYRVLNARQASGANRLGWKLSFEAAAEEGATYAQVDVQHCPVRYTMDITSQQGGPDVARLCAQVDPRVEWIDIPLPGPPGARHRYVLALRPPSTAAELWVDGVKYSSEYRGLNQYLYRRGAELGVARYGSARSVGVFWSFRFEIG